MSSSRRALMLSLVLALALALPACAARTVTYGSGSTGGPPPLPPGASVPMWDHYCAWVEGARGYEAEVSAMLDRASANGWELVTFEGATACFKRPRVTATEPGPPAPPPALAPAPAPMP